MGLSSELISQFVKITNDSKEKPKESTVYGTIKSNNGKLLVQLDGSSLLTPVISTANIKDGDRVTVMIKNHSAIVTGNVSSPSASNESLLKLSDDLGLVDGELAGITNDFDLLVKTVSEINNDLNTAESNITGLTGRVGTVEGKLNSINLNVVSIPYYNSGASESAINSFFDNFGKNFADGSWYRAQVGFQVGHSVLGGNTQYLEGMKYNADYEWQMVRSYNWSIKYRIKSAGAWQPWKTFSIS